MKWLSFTTLIAVLIGSYFLIYTPNLIDEKQVFQLENQMKDSIAAVLENKSYTDLRFKSFWSEVLTGDKIKMHFDYNFKDEVKNEVSLSGSVILNKIATSGDVETWKIESISVDKNHIKFLKEMIIEIKKG